jgi:hypothetical protein
MSSYQAGGPSSKKEKNDEKENTFLNSVPRNWGVTPGVVGFHRPGPGPRRGTRRPPQEW